ncbi:MAG: transcriptional regulator [Phycisphaerae bacterium]|jgi:DNA-binding transcriptional ArsR family regulator
MTAVDDGHQDESPGAVDRLIHEPARLHIMALLSVVESADFTFVVSQTGLSWGNVSSHVTKLETAGYVVVEKEFVKRKPRTSLRITDAGRTALREYRRHMRTILDDLPE